MRNIFGAAIVAVIAFVLGAGYGISNQPLNITGQIRPGFLKGDELTISFNGDAVFHGRLDSKGSGNFVGEWKEKPATAICSTDQNTACVVSYRGNETTIKFRKENQ